MATVKLSAYDAFAVYSLQLLLQQNPSEESFADLVLLMLNIRY